MYALCPGASLVAQWVAQSTCNTGDAGLDPGSLKSHVGGHGNPLQYSCLENPMDRGAWQVILQRIAKGWT